jgi:hypothetical protein
MFVSILMAWKHRECILKRLKGIDGRKKIFSSLIKNEREVLFTPKKMREQQRQNRELIRLPGPLSHHSHHIIQQQQERKKSNR